MSLDTLITHNLLAPAEARSDPQACALVLMGGGARTAYQAGVLKALAVMHTHWHSEGLVSGSAFPFRWLFGTSAGALNAAFLASHAAQGLQAFHALTAFWSALHSHHVYRLEAPGWVRANRIVAGLTLARQVRRHRALLDTLPLVDTLHRAISLQALEQALQDRIIDVLGVTASSYTTGEHWTFCQTRNGYPVRPWHRPGRRADFQPVSIEHLMASAAIPFLFPAVPLWVDGHREHFGDGSMRQLSPLSPAIQFGARRILTIGVGQPQRAGLAARVAGEPTAGTIAGHAMASVFHDTLQADVEQTLRVSQTLAQLPAGLAAALPYHPVQVLAIQPSFSLDELTRKHINSLPAATRNTLIGLGALDTGRGAEGSGAALASYLMFEPSFVTALIELGEHDAWRRQEELRAFFAPPATTLHQEAVP
ncbi:MAG: patatin-like phospholipase family protein [Hydrogenophaga sp.]|nr:patatin-like phospholipase family protein [Hydrogenophaga sp.]